MAIKAAVRTTMGVDTVSWSIVQLSMDFVSGSVQIVLGGWLSDDPEVKQYAMVTPVLQLPGLDARKDPSRSDIYKEIQRVIGEFQDDHQLYYLKPLATGDVT